MLGVAGVAEYLGVGTVTVYRWCREGRLPCLMVGKSWRIRRAALEDFLSRGERSSTLVGQLRAYPAVPDNVIAIAETTDLLHQLDAAFLQVGEARGGLLVKFHGGEPGSNEDELRAELRRNGLDVPRLEKQGRLRLVPEKDSGGLRRAAALRRRARTAHAGTIWLSEAGLSLSRATPLSPG